jgi:uncharacterized iron-regulated membrane protein
MTRGIIPFMTNSKKLARSTRLYRKLHHYVGSVLFAFFFIIAVTGVLLGWKKHSAGLLMPVTQTGTSTNLASWLPYDSLNTLAIRALPPGLSTNVDRIDARPDKGIVKFVFKDHYTEIQLDAATGKVLGRHQRTSDIIEQIHDGSILDFVFTTSNGQIKVSYTTVTGLSLLLLSVTGFFLWLNPIRIKHEKHKSLR